MASENSLLRDLWLARESRKPDANPCPLRAERVCDYLGPTELLRVAAAGESAMALDDTLWENLCRDGKLGLWSSRASRQQHEQLKAAFEEARQRALDKLDAKHEESRRLLREKHRAEQEQLELTIEAEKAEVADGLRSPWRKLLLQAQHLTPSWSSSKDERSLRAYPLRSDVPRTLRLAHANLAFVELYHTRFQDGHVGVTRALTRAVRPLDLEACAGCFPAYDGDDHGPSEDCFKAPLDIEFYASSLGNDSSLDARVTVLLDGRVVPLFDTGLECVCADDRTDDDGVGVYDREVNFPLFCRGTVYAELVVRRLEARRPAQTPGRFIKAKYVLDSLRLHDGREDDDDHETELRGAAAFRELCGRYHEKCACASCHEALEQCQFAPQPYERRCRPADVGRRPAAAAETVGDSWSTCATVSDVGEDDWTARMWRCKECPALLHGTCALDLVRFQARAHGRMFWLPETCDDDDDDDDDDEDDDEDRDAEPPFLSLPEFCTKCTPSMEDADDGSSADDGGAGNDSERTVDDAPEEEFSEQWPGPDASEEEQNAFFDALSLYQQRQRERLEEAAMHDWIQSGSGKAAARIVCPLCQWEDTTMGNAEFVGGALHRLNRSRRLSYW